MGFVGGRMVAGVWRCNRKLVVQCGLEFYPLGGDPRKLSALLVKTGGWLVPNAFRYPVTKMFLKLLLLLFRLAFLLLL